MRDVIAVRGATTVCRDDKEEVSLKSTELVKELIATNGVDGKSTKCVSLIISTTQDIKSYYPAKALRENEIIDTVLFSCLEPNMENSLPLCIRVLMTLSCEEGREPHHIYLHGAKALRPDLSNKN